MACIVVENGVMSCSVGIVKVVYIPDRCVLRLVGVRTGEVITEEVTSPLTRTEFKEIVERYKKLTDL